MMLIALWERQSSPGNDAPRPHRFALTDAPVGNYFFKLFSYIRQLGSSRLLSLLCVTSRYS
jgi:hypothetical protein